MKKSIYLLLIIGLVTTAFNNRKISKPFLPTSLKITVVDINNNPVEGVKVSLFGDENNYRASTNKIQETKETNSKGQVVFKKLRTKQYYIHAIKGDLSNIAEDVLTGKLLEGRINRVITMIN